jgi:hypothetical protein
VADRITGFALDAGNGIGENVLFFARRGHKVTGIDFDLARRTPAKRVLLAILLVMDAPTLKDWSEGSTAACSPSSATTTAAAPSRRTPKPCDPQKQAYIN